MTEPQTRIEPQGPGALTEGLGAPVRRLLASRDGLASIVVLASGEELIVHDVACGSAGGPPPAVATATGKLGGNLRGGRRLRDGAAMEQAMKVRKFAIGDAAMERSPGQAGEVFAGNLVDERDGGPITIGYGRYGPDQTLDETMAVHDVMIVLEGGLSVSSGAETVTAGPGEIVYMPKGEAVVIRSHAAGAVTAYVTYPHWRTAGA